MKKAMTEKVLRYRESIRVGAQTESTQEGGVEEERHPGVQGKPLCRGKKEKKPRKMLEKEKVGWWQNKEDLKDNKMTKKKNQILLTSFESVKSVGP